MRNIISFLEAFSDLLELFWQACIQTILAAIIFQNPISFVNGMGILLVLAGSAWYSQIKYQEMEAKPPLPK